MFFLEARTKIEEGEGEMAEVAGGDIAIPTPATSTRPSPRRKKKGKR
jgi:BRCA1-associated protein